MSRVYLIKFLQEVLKEMVTNLKNVFFSLLLLAEAEPLNFFFTVVAGAVLKSPLSLID